MLGSVVVLSILAAQVLAHYTFPSLIVDGVKTEPWVNVRMTNNHYSQAPVTNVTSPDLRCYTSSTNATARTISLPAGAPLGLACDQTLYHPGVVNVYMARARARTDVAQWDGDGQVWFKAHEITAVTDGGKSIAWPAQGLGSVNFTLPRALPAGQYLVRVEAIALHEAERVGGAQFYIACGQINVTGGGSGKPGPLVAIPGVYTGKEPGILIDINWPIPKNYTQPGPLVWTG
ncbi:glycoside hydrolase family 61 protein [Trametes versicolor FP-101664 SS1]|uniref:glycoside hydrolase family 61 protein n=1 Tax=Trametes versicolor (strain FP-101664) TaxID=717944 RepID=UPI0004622CF1|nr:glycoside hydrolase family 61 protein [Trametes versicolor FP-101664 SS1]EIW53754.1 glycoside hydrolase family 61 protein [Trametes versicolor FP-101664 SS1]